ncbi:MAG: tetratricopeptide repeat protein [Candidatus Thorarchaeota archaeon]
MSQDESVEFVIAGVRKAEARLLGEAEEFFRRAIKLNRENAVAWYNLGILLAEQNRKEEASKAYTEAIASTPGSIFEDAWLNLAMTRIDTGGAQSCIDTIDEAIQFIPQSDSLWNTKGVLHQALDQLQEAEECYRKAISINPNFDLAWVNLAKIYARTGRREEAKDALKKGYSGRQFTSLVDLEKQWAATRDELSDILPDWFTETMESSYQDIMAQEKMGGAILAPRSYKNPITRSYIQKTLSKHPTNAQLWMELGKFQMESEEYDDAEKSFKRALRLNAKIPRASFNLGMIFMKKGMQIEAVEAFTVETVNSPNSDDVWELLGKSLEMIGKMKESRAALDKAEALRNSRQF